MNRSVRSFGSVSGNTASLALCAVFTLLTLTGCHIPGLRKGKGAPPMPDNYNGTVMIENSALIGPCEFFDDPNLLGLINQALVGNQELRILAEDIQIANNEVLRARGAYLPFFSLGAKAGLDKSSEFTPMGAAERQLTSPRGGFPDPLPNFMVSADITWQIDIWRQLRNARDAQQFRFLGTQDGFNYTVTRLIADVAENYYTLLAYDQQMLTLDQTIGLQQKSIEFSKARKEAARDTELAVQRFEAEVRRNQSEKFIIAQKIVETENKINFLLGRFPQPVERLRGDYLNLKLQPLAIGAPAHLLQNRYDVRQAERELQAAGLDVQVARADFYPKLFMTANVGYEAFNTKYLFISPESLIYGAAAGLTAPVINRSAISAEYLNSNARQLQALYDYQRTVINAFTEVVNQFSKVDNYTRSIDIKKRQLDALESAVSVSGLLFQNARIEYLDVLTSQRDRNEARMILIETKKEQLAGIVNAYQALGGGLPRAQIPQGMLMLPPDAAAANGAGPAEPKPEEIPKPKQDAAPKQGPQPKPAAPTKAGPQLNAPLPPMPPLP
jgi:multidrug efflux system outer membrane protein